MDNFITKPITTDLYYFSHHFYQHEKMADFIAFFPFSTAYRWLKVVLLYLLN